MIQLHPDYLLIQTASGETIPCSAESVTVELIGDSVSDLDPEMIHHVSNAVLHYFKHDLGRDLVSVMEFSKALERVLIGLGFDVQAADPDPASMEGITNADLCDLLPDSGQNFELVFFPRLRDTLKNQLRDTPRMLCLDRLRDCVKQLTGAKRWNQRCQDLSDQIVYFVRHCMETESPHPSCSVFIR
jgi:hypothetical protein